MSQASELLGVKGAPHIRVVGAVSAAHFVSHYYILLLAPLLCHIFALFLLVPLGKKEHFESDL